MIFRPNICGEVLNLCRKSCNISVEAAHNWMLHTQAKSQSIIARPIQRVYMNTGAS